jgi:hypothetical protein
MKFVRSVTAPDAPHAPVRGGVGAGPRRVQKALALRSQIQRGSTACRRATASGLACSYGAVLVRVVAFG